MSQFERREFPESSRITYQITDVYGQRVELSPEEVTQLFVYLQDLEQQIIADTQAMREQAMLARPGECVACGRYCSQLSSEVPHAFRHGVLHQHPLAQLTIPQHQHPV